MAGARVHPEQRAVGILDAVAVPHAVKAREVAGGLRRREHVVGAERSFGVREVDGLQAGAERLGLGERDLEGGGDPLLDTLPRELLRHADDEALERFALRRRDLLTQADARHVAVVGAVEVAQHQRRVSDRARDGASLIER